MSCHSFHQHLLDPFFFCFQWLSHLHFHLDVICLPCQSYHHPLSLNFVAFSFVDYFFNHFEQIMTHPHTLCKIQMQVWRGKQRKKNGDMFPSSQHFLQTWGNPPPSPLQYYLWLAMGATFKYHFVPRLPTWES
jgi:hypothetical protein